MHHVDAVPGRQAEQAPQRVGPEAGEVQGGDLQAGGPVMGEADRLRPPFVDDLENSDSGRLRLPESPAAAPADRQIHIRGEFGVPQPPESRLM